MRGETAHFALTLKEVRAKVMPEADDEFARSVGKFEDMAELTADLRERLEANALDRARHDFADKIIEYAAANATIDVPEILIDQEVDVVRDEMRSAMARQGISEEAYLSITGKTEAEIREQVRPQAEQRVKSLLVLTEIAKVKAVEVPDSDVQAEVDQARSRYADDRTMVQYFESERGRNYIRSTFRRSRTVRATRRRMARLSSRGAATAPYRGDGGDIAGRGSVSGGFRVGRGGRTGDTHAVGSGRPSGRVARVLQRRRSDARSDGDRVLEPWRARL